MFAFTFPGQGSQKQGMGRPWRAHGAWEVVERASDSAGRDVEALLLTADDRTLTETRNSQLATFVLSMVVHRAVAETGIEPAVAAGHSLGEYSALTAVGALDFDDAVRLVTERGEAMQAAAERNAGTMAAVLGLEDELVEAACARADDDAWVANLNAPGQVVIAGSDSGVGQAAEIAKELGAKRAMPLPVGGAFHTPYMEPARARLMGALATTDFSESRIPVVANVDARLHSDAHDWSELLQEQLCKPVRWRQTILTLVEAGATELIELGPGAVLTGLAKRTAKDLGRHSIATPEDLDALADLGSPATQSASR